MKIQQKLRLHQRNAAKQNCAKETREARRFFSREKQLFLVGFSLTFPKFPRKFKNLLNTSLHFTCMSKRVWVFITTYMANNSFLDSTICFPFTSGIEKINFYNKVLCCFLHETSWTVFWSDIPQLFWCS